MAKDAPIQFKGTTLKIIQTQLRSADPAALHAALGELTGNAPDFFDNDLAVLDFSQAENLPLTVDWPEIRKLLRQSGLHAIATCGLPPALAASAAEAGLPSTPADAFTRSGRPAPRAAEALEPVTPAPAPEPAPVAPPPPPAPVAPPPPPEPPPRTVVVDKPLRSGQRVYAKGADLIVMAMVSAGAEVIADGNIHVYAPLRGRALAGASGDRKARIITTSLEAELISIAGLYRTFEAGVPADLARQPAMVSLREDSESLHVAPLELR